MPEKRYSKRGNKNKNVYKRERKIDRQLDGQICRDIEFKKNINSEGEVC